MVTDVLKILRDYKMLSAGEHVMCAFSGGVDSSVMLHVLLRLRSELKIAVSAAHLNHMLRGEDSMRDEEFVREICNNYGIPLVYERIDVKTATANTGDSVELAARKVRYAFLRRAAKELNADKIATAHNANDNLETILFNLARGSGLDGMCGIPPVRDDIIRPLISTPREMIEEYAEENSIPYCEDKTNAETVYSRNKLRHIAVPVLEAVNNAAVTNAFRAAKLMRSESDFLTEAAERAFREIKISGECSCEARGFLALHEAIRGRVAEKFARKALGKDDYTLEYRHIQDIFAISENESPSKEIHLPSGLRVRREYKKLVFEKEYEQREYRRVLLEEGHFLWGQYDVSVKKAEKYDNVNNSVNTFLVSCDKISGDLILRTRETGDSIKLCNRPEKTLKKLFIDEHIPRRFRDEIPVIADDHGVVAVYGFGTDKRCVAECGENIIYIEITKRAGV